MKDYKEEHFILKLEPKPCILEVFFIDVPIVIVGFWLSYVAFAVHTWWSYLLALIILLVVLGLGKSLLLKNVTLYRNKLILQWYFFKDKIILLNKIKEIRSLLVGFFCWKFTLLERQPFDYKSIWVIISGSILGKEAHIELEAKIKKLIEGN